MKRLPFASFRSLFCPGAFSPCPAQDKTQFSIHGTGGLRTAGFLGRRNSHCLPMVGMVINLRFPVIKGGARVYPQYKESIDPGTYSRGLSHRFKTFPDWWIVLNHSLIRCFVLEGLSYYWSRSCSHQFPHDRSLVPPKVPASSRLRQSAYTSVYGPGYTLSLRFAKWPVSDYNTLTHNIVLFVWYKHGILCPALSFSGCPHCAHGYCNASLNTVSFNFYSSNIGIGWYWKRKSYETGILPGALMKRVEVHHAVEDGNFVELSTNPFQTPEVIHFTPRIGVPQKWMVYNGKPY